MSFLPPGTVVRNKTVGGFVGEPVDLGLSVRWASWNVGACRPGEAGAYFAWGETDSCKDEYSWATYRHLSQYDEGLVERNENGEISDDGNINKYTSPDGQEEADWYNKFGCFIGDNKTVLDLTDDAASVNWGGEWRMPTAAELDELFSKCTWEWKKAGEYESGSLPGYLVTGPSGGSVFLPAAGDRKGPSLDYLGSGGFYWSSKLHSGYSFWATYLNFQSRDRTMWSVYGRCCGLSVRAVCPAAE